VADEAV
jgi:hypothetical protein